SDSTKTDLYARAGIEDVSEFYRTKFVSEEVLDARYFRALDRFDMRFARTMWVYDNVRAGSSLLDVGCGAGMLALLKRKGVALTGVDLSAECAAAARRNGYDSTCRASLSRLPFADRSFDYVASLDVLGHVGFEEKDAVLSEIRRVLRPGGTTLHGIECIDRAAQKDYDEMSPEELRRFVEVDGHVGLEEGHEHAARFRRFFAHVAYEPRYTLCLSSEEFVKQAESYGLPFEADFVEYLRGLSFRERRAFDMAMGYVFGKISDLHLRLPPSGLYIFLKASDRPLGPFYNEHRDRRALLRHDGRADAPETNDDDVNVNSDDTQNVTNVGSRGGNNAPAFPMSPASRRCLDRDPRAVFDEGWYEPNVLPPVARWMRERARVRFDAAALSALRLDLTTHLPDLSAARPLPLEIALDGRTLCAFSLYRYGWLELTIELPERLTPPAGEAETRFELELRAGRTWRPRPGDPDNRDDRELSVAVCNLEIFTR
ncbi:MAG TPA: class I SAM-dependent methyltransferase, partial [Pyrinomonadaceae bacterium]|nr:class I SAM-dependent methyltransferase [Pyrinomonadaceae bacterium]